MSSAPVPPEPADDSTPAALGELIVQNGRLRGTRRALLSSLTLLGRDPACEVCLNIEGVTPRHCAVVRGPDGFLLRDLGSEQGTRLNGEPVQTAPLRHGDVIGVGPFLFRIEHTASDPDEPALTRTKLEAERDALRIQAAAVAAQQAALAEEEGLLQQRRKALQRQKEQLGAHLEERRRLVLDLHEQTKKDRTALEADVEKAQRDQEEHRAALVAEHEGARREHEKVARERLRLVELRKRLWQRARRRSQAEDAALARQREELDSARAQLARDAEALERARGELAQARMRTNGEAELGRRRLQEEWQELALAQQQWEVTLNQEQAERARAQDELERRAAVVAAALDGMAGQKRVAEQHLLALRKEADGLEVRIRNQRRAVSELDVHLAKVRLLRPTPEGATGPAVAVVSRPAAVAPPDALVRLAGDLADQRLHLLEQWHCFLEVLDAWQPEQAARLAELEAESRRLLDREEALEAGMADLRRRQEVLHETRCSLEAWQARLTARETALESDRAVLLAQVRAHEERAGSRLKQLEELREDRARRRAEEIEAAREARAQHEQMRRDYALLWQECQERRAALAGEQRQLAARTLAVEEARHELLTRCDNTPAAEKRMERLQRRHLAHLEAEERELTRQQEALAAEMKRIDDRAARLIAHEEELSARCEQLAQRQAEWEERRAAEAGLEEQCRHELKQLQVQHEQDARQLATLREEVERMARLFMGEAEPPAALPVAASQAA